MSESKEEKKVVEDSIDNELRKIDGKSNSM
jgi:hypothetical protein